MSHPYDPDKAAQPQSPPPWESGPALPPPAAGGAQQQPYASYYQPQPGPAGQPPAQPQTGSWVARHKVLTALGAILAVFLVLGVIGAAVGAGSDGAKKTGVAAAQVTTPPLPPVSSDQAAANSSAAGSTPTADGVQETTPDAPAGYEPTAVDFTLAFKVTSKQCFGDAGCSVEGRVDFKSVSKRVPDDASVLVTFEIRGAEDGAVTDSIEIEDGNYDPAEEFFQTKSSGTKLSVVVTAVEES